MTQRQNNKKNIYRLAVSNLVRHDVRHSDDVLTMRRGFSDFFDGFLNGNVVHFFTVYWGGSHNVVV